MADRATLPRKASVRFALLALHFYKMYLSALMGGTCRFEPTCSNYAFEAVERFGVRRGCWLTLKRLARCQPLSRKFGFDPVPESWPEEEEESGILASISSENPGSVTLGPKEVVCQPQETSLQELKPHCEVSSYGTTESRALTQHEAHS